ncbi:hypothetical protein [Corynebacterium kalidii]
MPDQTSTPNTNLPITTGTEPKYLNVITTETPGTYHTDVIGDPAIDPRDHFRMAVHAMTTLAKLVARDTGVDPADALREMADAADLFIDTDARERRLFDQEVSGDADA